MANKSRGDASRKPEAHKSPDEIATSAVGGLFGGEYGSGSDSGATGDAYYYDDDESYGGSYARDEVESESEGDDYAAAEDGYDEAPETVKRAEPRRAGDPDDLEYFSDDGKYRIYSSSSLKKPVRDSMKSPGYKKAAMEREALGKPARSLENAHGYDKSGVRKESMYGPLSASDIKFVAGAAGVILLLIIIFVIFKISSLSGQLKTANEELAGFQTIEQEYESAKLSILTLEEEVASLTVQNQELLAAQTNAEEESQPTDGEENAETEPPNNGEGTTASNNSNASGSSALPATISVQESDTLWGLAVKYYGDGSKYTKIVTANNITEDTPLTVGMQLTIPE